MKEQRSLGLLPAASTSSSAAATTTVPTISAVASAAAASSSAALGFGPRFVHVHCAPAYLRTIERGNGFFSIFVASHFHKAEAARTTRITVGHDTDPVDLAVRLEKLPQFILRCVKAQISYENILHAFCPCIELSKCELNSADWQVGKRP
jgi:hypothetical protein